jgi:hypothetical protein
MYEYTNLNNETFTYDSRDENYWADCYEETEE